jgi:hypothetical protein
MCPFASLVVFFNNIIQFHGSTVGQVETSIREVDQGARRILIGRFILKRIFNYISNGFSGSKYNGCCFSVIRYCIESDRNNQAVARNFNSTQVAGSNSLSFEIGCSQPIPDMKNPIPPN